MPREWVEAKDHGGAVKILLQEPRPGARWMAPIDFSADPERFRAITEPQPTREEAKIPWEEHMERRGYETELRKRAAGWVLYARVKDDPA